MFESPKAMRFTPEQHARIDKFRSSFQKKTGVKLSFNEAVRVLLEKGLTQTEKKS